MSTFGECLYYYAHETRTSAAVAPYAHSDVSVLKSPQIEEYVEMLPDTRHTGIVGLVYSEYGYVSWPAEKRDIRFTPKDRTLTQGQAVTFKINHLTMRAYDLQRVGQEVIRPTKARPLSKMEAFKQRKAENEAKRANTLTVMRTSDGLYDIDDLHAYDDIEPTF